MPTYFSVSFSKWWWWPPYVSLGLLGMMAAAQSLLIPTRSSLLLAAFAVVTCVWFVWVSWLAPWFESDSAIWQEGGAPRHKYRFLRILLWSPFLTLLIAVGLIAGETILTQVASAFLDRWDHLVRWLVGLFVLAAVSAVVAMAVESRIERRLRRMSARVRACFECGYDLRGGRGDICPECGRKIECMSRDISWSELDLRS